MNQLFEIIANSLENMSLFFSVAKLFLLFFFSLGISLRIFWRITHFNEFVQIRRVGDGTAVGGRI